MIGNRMRDFSRNSVRLETLIVSQASGQMLKDSVIDIAATIIRIIMKAKNVVEYRAVLISAAFLRSW